MRKRALVFLTFALVVAVRAQGKNDVYIGAGPSFPLDPQVFTDSWNTGFNAGIGFGYGLSQRFSLIGSIDYNNFGLDENKFKDTEGGSVSVATISGNVKFKLSSRPNAFSPYLLGGIGFMHLSTANTTVGKVLIVSIDSKSEFFIQTGYGFDFPVGTKENLFVEARYGIGYTQYENTTFLLLRIGLRESF